MTRSIRDTRTVEFQPGQIQPGQIQPNQIQSNQIQPRQIQSTKLDQIQYRLNHLSSRVVNQSITTCHPGYTRGSMRVLEYSDLDTGKVKKTYAKLRAAIEREDFKSADLKKLAQGTYHRAKLDENNRLLVQFVRYRDELACLALEVIHAHAYEKSRFLRGASVDENKIVASEASSLMTNATPLRYLHPSRQTVYLLDKVISFDDAQDAIYRQAAPLVVVGSAGSGKTALTLEKLRLQVGRVLYVTHSAFLAQSARDLYFAHGQPEDQDAVFLSFREFLETIRVPEGREVTYRDFRAWFERQPNLKFADAHQLFEEFRGVISSPLTACLTRAEYLDLGVRQSIFANPEREAVFAAFEKYREWLRTQHLFDSNLVSHEWRALVEANFDFVVVDEVQDLTMAQLGLILGSLAKPGQFLLCGDSNQIVHPNFFSWANVKSLFWHDDRLAQTQALSILQVNFRNATEVTRVANAILKVKHARFGSVDRESNFLVQPVAETAGSVEFLASKDSTHRALNDATSTSTQFAVLVLRDEDKPAARKQFATPLVFSIHEAKGLEYPNIILFNLISTHRQTFNEICEDVRPENLEKDNFEYRRARDKNDKSLEVYKFFVNALYVAVTRAIQRVILIESDTRHPLLDLLKVREGQLTLENQRSSREDWEREAAKLESQGKLEQAEAIRSGVLRVKPVPWEVLNLAGIAALEAKAFDPKNPHNKAARALFEDAVHHRQFGQIERLHATKLMQATSFLGASLKERGWTRKSVHDKLMVDFGPSGTRGILAKCNDYGVEYRTPINATPLMMAAVTGNLELLEALIARGANIEATDHYGQNALMLALARALKDAAYAKGPFGRIFDLVAPHSLDLQIDGRLLRLYPHMAEYFFLIVMMASCKTKLCDAREQAPVYASGGRQDVNTWLRMSQLRRESHWPLEDASFVADDLGGNIDIMPENVVSAKRKTRQYFNHVLARAERSEERRVGKEC